MEKTTRIKEKRGRRKKYYLKKEGDLMNIYACYENEYGEYVWTNKPQSNWRIITDIKSPNEAVPRTVAPDSNSRFVVETVHDNTKVILDRATNYKIYETNGEYYVENEQGKEIYHIYQDGTTSFKMANGESIVSDSKWTIADITKDTPISTQDGRIYTLNNGYAEEVTDYTKYPRFYTIENNNGKTILDRYNNYKIFYTPEHGYIANNDKGEEVYHIYPDGVTSIKTNVGIEVATLNPLTIEDIGKDMVIEDAYSDKITTIKDGKVVSIEGKPVSYKFTYEDNGDYCKTCIDEDDGEMKIFYHDGKEYKSIVGDEYSVLYLSHDDADDIILNPDGTCKMFKDGKMNYYTYTYDNSNLIIKDENNNQQYYDKYGNLFKRIDANGTVYEYDYEKNAQKSIKSNGVSISRINHIQYDEEEYEKIIYKLKEIEDLKAKEIISNLSYADEMINCFPDLYWQGSIENNITSIDTHLQLVKSLNEMINYSLLAYQSCDESLRYKLYKLVDNLFENNNISSLFKAEISNNINNNNGILSFNDSANFNRISSIIDIMTNKPNIELIKDDELTKFLEFHSMKQNDSTFVTKEVENINGIDFEIYRVIDIDNYDSDGFNKYVKDSNKALSNVDRNVLKYIKNTGGSLIYCSGHSISPELYDHAYAGLANPCDFSSLSVYDNRWDDPEAIVHEMGHTLDHCIRHNQTGDYGSTTDATYNYGTNPMGISTRELAHREYSAYYPDYTYVPDYSNESQYIPCEFFAESFRNYYSLDEEKRARYAATLPETFKFFDTVEEWVGGKV